MFGSRLKQIRTQHNITALALAEMLGVTSQTISKWENGQQLPPIDMLVKIATLFSVQTDFLLGLDNRLYLSAEGLTDRQIAHIQQIIDDLRTINRHNPK